PLRQDPDGSNRAVDAARACLELLGILNRFDIFALVSVAELPPSLPGWRRGFQRPYEVGRRRDLPFVGIELEPHLDRLAALQARSLAIAPPQRNARRSSHACDRTPVRVPV